MFPNFSFSCTVILGLYSNISPSGKLICPPGKLIDKLKTPESTLAEIRAIDESESAVNAAVMGVENCCTRPKTRYIFMSCNTISVDFSASREHN